MNKLKQLLIGAAVAVLPYSAVAVTVHAADLTGNLSAVNDTADLGSGSLTDTVGTLISVFLGLLGIIFLLLTIYAGFLWMTAAGDDKKVGTAKNILISAVVGLVVILSAYAISTFVIENLQSATNNS